MHVLYQLRIVHDVEFVSCPDSHSVKEKGLVHEVWPIPQIMDRLNPFLD